MLTNKQIFFYLKILNIYVVNKIKKKCVTPYNLLLIQNIYNKDKKLI